MNLRKVVYLTAALSISVIGGLITHRIFFSKLGPVVVDYGAFAAGTLLIGEGLYRLASSNEQTFRINLFRILRILIGACILTIHCLQFLRDGRLGA